MFSQLGVPELLIIGAVLVFLFGAKKLPDTAKALGQSLRLFKKETAKDRDEADVTVVQTESAPPPQIPPAVPTDDRIRALEEENRRLRATAEPTVNGVPLSQVQNEQRSS